LLLILLPRQAGVTPSNRLAPSAHQAPTLIGCKFLKIVSHKAPDLLRFPASSALLRQQQRNEIMKTVSRFVNSFFASPPSAV